MQKNEPQAPDRKPPLHPVFFNQGASMKLSTAILSLLVAASASARNYPGMSERDMQNMMQQMQGAQTCMEGIDQSRLQAFEQQARKVESEVKSLCANGKRDAAQTEAVAFAQKLAGDPDIQKIRQCSEMMSGMMPAMPFMDQAGGPDASTAHVCDQ
jgi:hypothetical protein